MMNSLTRTFTLACIGLSVTSMIQAEEKQQFTFVTEPAYLQSKGEWQVNAGIEWQKNNHGLSNQFAPSLSAEYGIFNYLQLELGASWQPEHQGANSFKRESEIEIGLSYTIIFEDEFMPQIAAGVAVSSEDGDTEIEAVLSLSKQLEEEHFIHGNLAVGGIGDDESLSLMAGYAFKVTDETTLVAELSRTRNEVSDNLLNDTFYDGLLVSVLPMSYQWELKLA